jgi:hypothetical protein
MPLYLAPFAQYPAEKDAPSQLGVCRIADLILAQITMQPVGEVEEAVIDREDQIGNQAGHRNGPTC